MTENQKDVVIQTLERNERHREITTISETGDEEHGMQCFKVLLQKELEFNEETMKVMEWRVRCEEQEQR